MADSRYDDVVAQLGKLSPRRQKLLVAKMNEQIRESGSRPPGIDDLPMAVLARRIYWLGLRWGIKIKAEAKSKAAKSGPPVPQHQKIEEAMDLLASTLRIAGFERLEAHSKTVELFCTHKVTGRGNKVDGFYALAALYAWHEEEKGSFDPGEDRHIIPDEEVNLGLDIYLFFARRLNEEAAANGEQRPFPKVPPARPDTDLTRVPFFYLQHREHGERMSRIVDRYRTPQVAEDGFGDGCAHFILYRERLSLPADVMKSFLVIKPLVVNARDKRVQHHPTFHIYQAPLKLGGASWATPGRVLPLNAGVFIIGGQHARELDTRTGKIRDAGAPFRALEMIFFPWEAFESAPLIGGLMMSVNNDGEPLVGRVCARPTLIQFAKEARTGAVSLGELHVDMTNDLEAEHAAAAQATNIDSNAFLDIYERFGSIENMAERAAELCNNHSDGSWGLMPGLSRDGRAIRDSDIEGMFEEAIARVVNARGEAFSIKRDIRVAPLTEA